MAGFSDLAEDDKLLVVSLPYRIGIWVSNADDNSNTSYDDNVEAQALEETLVKISGQSKQPFAASIAKHTIGSKKAWRTWYAQSTEALVLDDLSKVLDGCAEALGAEHLAEYKKLLWHVGLSVARSFGEHIDPDNEMHMNRLFSKWFGGRSTASKENVSEAEKIALKKLQSILKA